MLQRAASNAYSWWWASRIRTSQSKWLDGNLEEMDDRVKVILKLLTEEADSFAKRAEMYYKKRPEVISNVEEAYRAYRALAERYDHVSGELHKANHTIATAFPEQVQYALLEDDDEDDSEHVPKAITPIDPTKIRKSTVEGLLKKRKQGKKKGAKIDQVKITKEKAQQEINRLQKAILVLQTEKEFIKSSYETGIAKYWEIEKQMAELQEEVIVMQEESGETGTVIDDDDARALMTATALKSCEEAILKLQETQRESVELAKVESERIRVAIERLRSIKGEGEVAEDSQSQTMNDSVIASEETGVKQVQSEKVEVILEKVKKHFELNPETSVQEIAEKIDEVVGKVIELEMTVSSQTAQIGRLSEENGELEKNLEELEKEKVDLVKDSNELNKKLKEVEEELKRVKESERVVKEEEMNVNSEFKEVFSSLSSISKRFDGTEEDNDGLIISDKDNLVNNEAEISGEKEKSEENVEELSKESDSVDLVKSESSIVINEAETSGEKDKKSEIIPFVLLEEELKEKDEDSDLKIGEEESNENLNLVSEESIEEELNEKDGELNAKIEENELEENLNLISEESNKEEEELNEKDGELNVKTEEKESKENLNLVSEESIEEELNEKDGELNATIEENKSKEILNLISEETKEELNEKDGELNVKTEEKESKENLNSISKEEEEEQVKEIINEEKEAIKNEFSKKKQKETLLSDIMEESDSISFEKNKKTLKRGISLQQGEKEYASLSEKDGMLSWQALLLDGLEGRDSILLAEYTTILKNYKDTKRRLNEMEKRNQDQFNDTSRVVRELRKDNALKDEEIRFLKQLVSSLKIGSEDNNVISEEEIVEENKIEEKLKGDIDSTLDENFKFMLRFSASLNRIPDFESKFKDLQTQIQIEIENSDIESIPDTTPLQTPLQTPNRRPETTEKKLRDLKTEIEVWVEQITMLKQELKSRISSLNNTQDEISQAVRASSATDGSRLSVYQGEVLSMQQGTEKAENELNAGLDVINGIRLKIESELGKIRESFELPSNESEGSESRWNSFRQYPTRNRVPLRNFLFGPKPKPKKKNKFFEILNPIIQRHLRDFKRGGNSTK